MIYQVGRFVFMMFFSPEDEESRDELAIRTELDIQSGGANPFNIQNVFDFLNANIPQHYTLRESVEVIQGRQAELKPHLKKVVDDAKKIHLLGPVPLPSNKKPREKTLRKLYLYIQSHPNVILQLIDALKAANWTLAWSETPPTKQRGLIDMINEIRR